jgi:hypothetical protein
MKVEMHSVNVRQSVAFWEYVGTVKNLVEMFSAVAYNRLVSKPTGLPMSIIKQSIHEDNLDIHTFFNSELKDNQHGVPLGSLSMNSYFTYHRSHRKFLKYWD